MRETVLAFKCQRSAKMTFRENEEFGITRMAFRRRSLCGSIERQETSEKNADVRVCAQCRIQSEPIAIIVRQKR